MKLSIVVGILVVSLCGCASSTATPLATATPSATATSTSLSIAATTTSTNRQFTLVSSGDLLLHERTWTQARADGKHGNWDFYPQLADLRRMTVPADIALCHLETPLAKLGGPYSGYPIFNSPPQIVHAVKKLGFDMCDQTSNHSFDAGSAGIKRTLDALDKAGIAHTGTYRTKTESTEPLVMTVHTSTGDVKVGIIAFTYGFNGLPYPGGQKWRANKIGVSKIEAAARKARAAGAEVVVAKLHWGDEYTNYPNSYQTSIAKKLAKSGLINLIDGDHTHSVQPIQKIGNMWVVYSHGNLDAAQREPLTIKSEGIVTRWTFSETTPGVFAITKAEFAPTLITDSFPVRVLDVNRALHTGKWVSTTKPRLKKALSRTSKTVKSMGANVQLMQNW